MSAKQLAIAPEIGQLVPYDLTEQQIGELRATYSVLTFGTPADYEVGRKAIAHVRSLRTAVEARRVELKAAHLARGRRIDDAAKALTALLIAIETPLKEKKADVDDAAEHARRAAEDNERAVAEAKAKEERRLEDERLAEERRQLDEQRKVFEDAQRKADAERVEREKAERAERERVDAEQRVERERLTADRRALEEEQRKVREQKEGAERAERERLAKIEAERMAVEQAERERIEAERRAAEEKAAAEAEAARLEAMKPDLDRVLAWAGTIREFSYTCPTLSSERAQEAIAWSTGRLEFVAIKLCEFVAKGGV